MTVPQKKGLKIFLIVLAVIVILSIIFVSFMWYKMTHIISEETVAEVMEIYKTYHGEDKVVTLKVIDSVTKLGIITSINQADYRQGPITVTPAKLNGESVTLVTLGGTQNREGQATTMDESKLASDGLGNDYLTAVVNLFKDGTVPLDKPVFISGISLGGMIAQQLLGESYIMDNFTIKAVVTFGSPITMPFDRKGVKVVRFVDSNDIVPKLGEMGMKNKNDERIKSLQDSERIMLTGSHKDGVETHALSYISDEVWNAYDILGVKGGNAVLELEQPLKFYEAPKLEK